MLDGTAFDDHGPVICEPSHEFDHDAIDENMEGEINGIVARKLKAELAQAVYEGVSRFAAEILCRPNPKLTVTSFAFAANMFINEGKSETQLAKELGVTRAAFSARTVAITKALGLPPSRGMKTEKARESYAERAREVHAR